MKKVLIFISFLVMCGGAWIIAEKPITYNDTIENNDSVKIDTVIYRGTPVINTPVSNINGQ